MSFVLKRNCHNATNMHGISAFYTVGPPAHNTVYTNFSESYKPIEYFSVDDYDDAEFAKRNIKIIFKKKKIRNMEECFQILETFAPSTVLKLVDDILHTRNKKSTLHLLRKLKDSDPEHAVITW